MKRVDTFGFWQLAAAGVPLGSAWALRRQRLSPFQGSLVRSALKQRRRQWLIAARPLLSQFACWSLQLGRLR